MQSAIHLLNCGIKQSAILHNIPHTTRGINNNKIKPSKEFPSMRKHYQRTRMQKLDIKAITQMHSHKRLTRMHRQKFTHTLRQIKTNYFPLGRK